MEVWGDPKMELTIKPQFPTVSLFLHDRNVTSFVGVYVIFSEL